MTRKNAIQVLTLLAALVILATAGCGTSPTFVEVEGTLTANGNPLDNILVQFLPDPTKENGGPHSSGVTDQQGRFRLKATTGKDGAVVGWHCVVLEDLSVDRPAQGQAHKHPPRINAQYSSAASTAAKVEVVAGKKDYDIRVD
jgi:hypothetical protein